jgi:hypothetical protein
MLIGQDGIAFFSHSRSMAGLVDQLNGFCYGVFPSSWALILSQIVSGASLLEEKPSLQNYPIKQHIQDLAT